MITKKQIEKWNSDFQTMSKEEKRVAIAKDVIAQIKAKRYTPKTGNYVKFKNRCKLKREESIQQNFDKVDCKVCAIGSMFMSNIKFNNKFTLVTFEHSGKKQAKKLAKYFSKKDLNLMEYVFENWKPRSTSYWAPDTFNGALNNIKYTESEIQRIKKAQELFKAKTPKDRLVKIMTHLVENRGSFKL